MLVCVHVALGCQHCLLHGCVVQVGGDAGGEATTKVGEQVECGCMGGLGWRYIGP